MNNIYIKDGRAGIKTIRFTVSGWQKVDLWDCPITAHLEKLSTNTNACGIITYNGIVPLSESDEETVRKFIAVCRLKNPEFAWKLRENDKESWDKVRCYQTSCFSSAKAREEKRADFRAKHIHLTKTGIPVIRVMDIHKRQSVNISHAGLHDSGISLDFPIVAFATTGFGYVPTLDEYEPTLELFLDMCHTFGYRNNAKIAGKKEWQKIRESYWRNPRGERW